MSPDKPPEDSVEDYRQHLRESFPAQRFAEEIDSVMRTGTARDKTRVLASIGKYLGLEVPSTINHVVDLGASFASTIGLRASSDAAPLPGAGGDTQ